MTFFTMVLILVFIIDPLGNVAAFRETMHLIPKKRRSFLFFREMVIALGLMLFFSAVGELLFKVLMLTEPAVKLSIGLVLFLSALKILFFEQTHPRRNLPAGEPFIVPLATPLLAGPPLLATIMLFAHLEPSLLTMTLAIFLAWGVASIILFFSDLLYNILGANGLRACESLMGMVLVMLAIQRFMEGIKQFISIHVG